MLHRDIKPPNILLDAALNAKLADVGLAKQAHALQEGRTHLSTRNLAGTVGYIDPLYSDSGQYSQTTDAYAMGITLLVALSGRHPREAKEAADNALENPEDTAAVPQAIDQSAGWPVGVAQQMLRVVKGLTYARQQRHRMTLATALRTLEGVCEDQGLGRGMAEPAEPAAARECVICMDAPRATRFRPCGHSQCCEACAAELVDGNARCPSCRELIQDTDVNAAFANENTFVQIVGHVVGVEA